MLAPRFSEFWQIHGVRDDFLKPTPEPATLLLVGGAFTGAALRRRLRA